MLTLIYDTETTGRVDFRADFDSPNQPGLVQLAAALYADLAEPPVSSLSLLVAPTNCLDERLPVPAEATAIHGITEDMVRRCGVDQRTAIEAIVDLAGRADRVCAYNAPFDDIVVAAAIWRSVSTESRWVTLRDRWGQRQHRCVMLGATEPCALPNTNGYSGYKWPKLQEAYRILVDPDGFDGAHDAMADVRATAAVLSKIDKGEGPRLIRSCLVTN